MAHNLASNSRSNCFPSLLFNVDKLATQKRAFYNMIGVLLILYIRLRTGTGGMEHTILSRVQRSKRSKFSLGIAGPLPPYLLLVLGRAIKRAGAKQPTFFGESWSLKTSQKVPPELSCRQITTCCSSMTGRERMTLAVSLVCLGMFGPSGILYHW